MATKYTFEGLFMEALGPQVEEIYNRDFSEKIEKHFDEIENDPEFCVGNWFQNTVSKAVFVFSRYVKNEDVQFKYSFIRINQLYSRKLVVQAIKDCLLLQLIDNKNPPKGYTFSGHEVRVITTHPGWIFGTTRTGHFSSADS